MVKKAFLIIPLLVFSWSCQTFQPHPPSFHIDSLPPAVVAELSLDERIAIEDAWSSLRQGNLGRAQRIISRLDPQSPAHHLGQGYIHFTAGDLQAAEKSFRLALEILPDMTAAYLGLAQLYQKRGQDEMAFTAYQEVTNREPDHPWARQEYEILRRNQTQLLLKEAKSLLAEGHTEKSKEALLKSLHYSPRLTEAHLALAEIFKKENRLQNALLHLRAASEEEPKNKAILKNYAETLFQAEQYGRSLDIYERLSELDPKDKDVAGRIESLKNRLGIFELPSQYDSIPVAEAVTKEDIAALIAVKFKDVLDDSRVKPPIIIDITTSWASRFILRVTSFGLLDVYGNHTFQPRKTVTRAEMAEILMRLASHLNKKGHKLIQQIPPERIRIADVSPDNYYHQPIVQVLSYQLMDLSRERTFRPEQALMGKEAIRILDILLALIR